MVTMDMGRVIDTEVAKAFLPSSLIHDKKSGTSIIPPPEPNKPLTVPPSRPQIISFIFLLIKTHLSI
jgi:hypothetical protein